MNFRKEYAYLSNFAECRIKVNGLCFTSVEAAFQSFKTTNVEIRKTFQNMSPSQAKQAGRKLKLRSDWEEVKVPIMLNLVRIKFKNNPEYAARLKALEGPIVEDNGWGDTFWGVCRNRGENWLGKILEAVRYELQTGKKAELKTNTEVERSKEMKKVRVIIAGSRYIEQTEENYKVLEACVDKYLANFSPSDITIISGGARGADRLGEHYALKHNIECVRCPAQWDKFGKSAGYKRNVQMAEHATHLIAFPTESRETSKGTHHMIDIAKQKGLKIKVITVLPKEKLTPPANKKHKEPETKIVKKVTH